MRYYRENKSDFATDEEQSGRKTIFGRLRQGFARVVAWFVVVFLSGLAAWFWDDIAKRPEVGAILARITALLATPVGMAEFEKIGCGAIGILLLGVTGFIWWEWEHIVKRPGIERFIKRFKRRATPTKAYEALLARTFGAEQRTRLYHEPAARYVPQPFQEAFEHPQTRSDIKESSFVADIIGNTGLAFAIVSLFIAVVVISLSTGIYSPGPAHHDPGSPRLEAETLYAQQKAIELIESTADRICNVAPTRGEANSSEVNVNINAQLNGLISKLRDVGVSGSGSINSEEYQNVLRQELASTMKDNVACKLKVFDTLQSILLGPPPAPAPLQAPAPAPAPALPSIKLPKPRSDINRHSPDRLQSEPDLASLRFFWEGGVIVFGMKRTTICGLSCELERGRSRTRFAVAHIAMPLSRYWRKWPEDLGANTTHGRD